MIGRDGSECRRRLHGGLGVDSLGVLLSLSSMGMKRRDR